jgi:hypothetical protein
MSRPTEDESSWFVDQALAIAVVDARGIRGNVRRTLALDG